MQAILFPGNAETSLVTLDRPAPAPDGVLVRLTASGVCGTDVHYWHETPQQRGRRRHVVPGHEVVGVIEECGSGVAGLARGDRVVVGMLHIGCGQCRHCAAGRHAHCPDKDILGRTLHGSYGEFVAAPARAVYHLPDALPDEIAVLAACNLSTSFAAVRKTQLRAGQRLVVLGLGGVGLCAVLTAAGAGLEVVSVDPITARRETALRLGAAQAFDPEEFAALLADDRDAARAEATVECSGNRSAQQIAIDALGPGGRAVVVGGGGGFAFPADRLLGREITIQGTSVCPADLFHEVLDLATARQNELTALLGPRFTIEQAAQALQHSAAGREGKPLFGW